MNIPVPLLRRLYTIGSLRNTENGPQFSLKNRLSDAELTGLNEIRIDGGIVSLDRVRLGLADQTILTPSQVDPAHPLPFPLRSTLTVQTNLLELKHGGHKIEMAFEVRPFGTLHLKVEDAGGNYCECGAGRRDFTAGSDFFGGLGAQPREAGAAPAGRVLSFQL